MTNAYTAEQILELAKAIVEAAKSVDMTAAKDGTLAPLANILKDVAAIGTAAHTEIETRVLLNNQALPGVSTKMSVTHRAWSDQEAAESLAQELIGDKAFKRSLLSPAQMEKLGTIGEQFVAVASYKPEGRKVVVY